MKVILRKNLKQLGRSGEIVTVSDGFGRNYLIPYGYAVLAQEQEMEKFQTDLRRREGARAATGAKAAALVKKFQNLAVEISAKASASDHLYAGLKESEILASIKKRVPDLSEAAKLVDYSTIKSIGQSSVKIDLGYGHIATVEVKVTASKKS